MPLPPNARRVRRTVTATAVLLAVALTGTPSVASPATLTIRPAELERGANPAIPWVFDGTVLHGSLRVDVPDSAWLLGQSGDDYLVQVPGDEQSRVVRVAPDGTRTRVLELPAAHQVMLAGDGTTLIRTAQRRVEGVWRTVMHLHDPVTGDETQRRRFGGIVDVLDAEAGRAVLSSWTPRERTLLWDLAADTTEELVRQRGYIADLGADRLGTFTKDPYLGGCTVLRVLSNPGEVLSRSCEERAAAVSPSGLRVATIHILSDGIGPQGVTVRRDTGRELADYRVGGWFGRIDFESDRALLLDANGRERQAVVRCDGATCERASSTRPTPQY